MKNLFKKSNEIISTVVPEPDLVDEALGLTFATLASILKEHIVMEMFIDEIVREGDADTATRDWVRAEDFAEWVITRANAIKFERGKK